MPWIILTILTVIALYIYHFRLPGWFRSAAPHIGPSRDPYTGRNVSPEELQTAADAENERQANLFEKRGRHVAALATGCTITGWLLLTLLFSVHNVSTGHVGLVKTGGAIQSQRGNGWVIIPPFQSLEQVDVRSHTVCAKGETPEEGNCKSTFEPFSKDNIDVHVHGTLTYHVDPGDIQFLYTKIGPSFQDKVVLVMLSDVVRVEFNKFGYQNIAANRAEIDKAITDNMSARIAAHPQPGVKAIKIDAFNTLNFDFNQDVKDAINQKVLENEKANAATARLLTAQKDAEAREAGAKGDAKVNEARATGDKNSAITRAEGESQANNLINASLTTNLLALRISENQKIQWGLVQPGTSIIGTLSDLFKSGGAVAPAVPAPAPSGAR